MVPSDLVVFVCGEELADRFPRVGGNPGKFSLGCRGFFWPQGIDVVPRKPFCPPFAIPKLEYVGVLWLGTLCDLA